MNSYLANWLLIGWWQNEQLCGLHRQREEEMRVLTSQLLLLEANMRVKQHKIDALLNQRDRTINEQQERINSLEKQLLVAKKQRPRPDSLTLTQPAEAGSDPAATGQVVLLACHDGDDSLDDSDSAVVIEDGPESHSPGYKEQDARNSAVSSISFNIWLFYGTAFWIVAKLQIGCTFQSHGGQWKRF